MLSLSGAGGGGQLVRSAATFAALTGRPVEVTDVRGAREESGLKRQHVAAVEAVARACDADVTCDADLTCDADDSGVAVGAERVAFDPGPLAGGDTTIDVGTAGSVPLVLDAVLPLALELDAPYRVTVRGGTDVRWAPTLDYLRYVKLPLLRSHGLDASVSCSRRGFYPAGGGEATLTVRPSEMDALSLRERGPLASCTVHSAASDGLRGADVAERQADAAADALRERVAAPVTAETAYAETDSPGSVVTLLADYGTGRGGFCALGARGVPAETVGREAVDAFDAFDAGAASVDGHLGDQLLPYVALAGGTYTTPALTDHLATHADLLDAFGFDVAVTEADGGVLVDSA